MELAKCLRSLLPCSYSASEERGDYAMRPARKITAEEERFRVEEHPISGLYVIRRDPREPEPVGTIVLTAFRITGYDRDCDGSLMARLQHIDGAGLATGWEQTNLGLYEDTHLVVTADELRALFPRALRVILTKPVKAPKERKRMKRTTRPRKERKASVAALKRKLWTLVARYVLKRDNFVCYTCGAVADQAGHFYSRRIASTWIDPKNLAAQDARCNLFLHGNPGVFSDRIRKDYGDAEHTRLTNRACRVTKQWKAPELEALIAAIQRDPAEFECRYYEENL